MKEARPWYQTSDDAPDWAKGDFPWYTVFVIAAPPVLLAGPMIWLTDRGGPARVLVAVLMAATIWWLAWILPRIRKDPPIPPPD